MAVAVGEHVTTFSSTILSIRASATFDEAGPTMASTRSFVSSSSSPFAAVSWLVPSSAT